MNINDLPQELFELILHNAKFNHLPLINSNYILFNNNKCQHLQLMDLLQNINLIKFYVMHKYTKNIIYRNICYCSVEYNYLKVLKWACNNKCSINLETAWNFILDFIIDNNSHTYPIIRTVMRYNRLKILQWLYKKYDLTDLKNNNSDMYIIAILYNNIDIIKWVITIGVKFTSDDIKTALKYKYYKMAKIMETNNIKY